ncbi:exodeoxyribonuclease V subunit beta [Pseudoalteromonas byunsanensis]|uniref:RecBCD enzyme subunit RecB n=1 Tax=Pseudoalteromonas byunsanensis TaxID=327939 RepID=A0A1S1NBQ9_9GAMM|nr:exodeoxyribonuclease V subunit beta [Pseudoalteromonas byunsanensis]OHU96854.1 exodeoxyribonuclease V subunit beta [Pseudoalteromonas byunsanensis]
MQTLKPQSMPLVGANLIEASAGTGKTYTITGLYLRCLLGLQTPPQQQSPLTVEQILVVTFTEAATQEIKDRVRSRILLARDTLLGAHCDDVLINSVLSQVEDSHQAFTLLDAAAKSIDEAAIFTIHGFCQRMLKQHAFESNVAFNLEFVLDESELILEAIKDHWRSFVYPLDKDTTQAVIEHFASPQALAGSVIKLLSKEQALITPRLDLKDVFQAREAYQQQASRFKQSLLESDFFTVLSQSALAKNKAPGRVANIEALIAYCQSEDWYFEFGSAKHSFSLWGEASLSNTNNYKKGGAIVEHPLIASFDEMARLHEKVSKGMPLAILQYSVAQVRKLLQAHKAQHGLISPDDLLSQLYRALQSEQGVVLRQKIAQLFPIAMIDEFQDTDPVQYGIFDAIYGENPDTTMTMIGDPKQAIYGFRGADIFTYIHAKQQVNTHNQYTLGTNFRSATGMVNAVNAIFSCHEHSFIYNQAIPFAGVAAKGKSAQHSFSRTSTEQTSLVFSVYTDEAVVTSKTQALPVLARAYADKIVNLLLEAQRGEARIGEQSVKAGDICVLVRDRNEASMIKSALAQCAVPSVYLARDSIFSQPIAYAILNFLEVLHGKYDEAALRGILVSPLFALNYQQIYQLRTQEQQWQSYLDQFSQLHKLWSKQGAMAMLEQLLVQNRLPALWKAKGYNVERWLTDYRHLAELLQQKQIELDGTLRVLRWFSGQCQQAQQDSAQVRLESDADLVKIVTMHASKGLEYPIVYMPFASSYRETTEAVYHKDGKLIYSLDATEGEQALAQQERLAEDIRLLYVALTRAIHFCDVGLFNIAAGRSKKPGITQTAIGYVLFGDQTFQDAQNWHQRLQTFCDGQEDITLSWISAEDSAPSVMNTQHVESSSLAVKPVTIKIERDWRATSFSQLSYHSHSDERPAGALDENHQLDLPEHIASVAQQVFNSYTFPKGAKPGSCLHEIFELIDFSDPLNPGIEQLGLHEAVEKSLTKYHIDEQWQEPVKDWILACLKCQLDSNNELSLCQLSPAQCLVEMEFHLPLEPLQAGQLNRLVSEITGQHSQLQFEQVKGLLKGFIDLIFVYQERYYILDYKSNYLGDKAKDYDHSNLQLAMDAHHYHLQYMIYSVALHRLLSQRLSNYDPNKHLGGVYYLFLRALPDGTGVYFNQLTIEQLLELDALFTQGRLL